MLGEYFFAIAVIAILLFLWLSVDLFAKAYYKRSIKNSEELNQVMKCGGCSNCQESDEINS